MSREEIGEVAVIFLLMYCNKAFALLYMSTRLTLSNKEAGCMVDRQSPLLDGKERIIAGHLGGGLSSL